MAYALIFSFCRFVVPESNEGRFYSWVTLDAYGYTDGVSTNVIFFRMGSHGDASHFSSSYQRRVGEVDAIWRFGDRPPTNGLFAIFGVTNGADALTVVRLRLSASGAALASELSTR